MGHGAGTGAARQVHAGGHARAQQRGQGNGVGLCLAKRLGAAAGTRAGADARQRFMVVAQQAQGRQFSLGLVDVVGLQVGQHQALPGAQAQAAIAPFTGNPRGTTQHGRGQPALRRGYAKGNAICLRQRAQPRGAVLCALPGEHGGIAADVQAEPIDEIACRAHLEQLAHARLHRGCQVEKALQHRTHQPQALRQRHGAEHLAVRRAARQAKRQPGLLLQTQGR
ncbi:hypothetical protein D3C76_1161440 [compost metagenome]